MSGECVVPASQVGSYVPGLLAAINDGWARRGMLTLTRIEGVPEAVYEYEFKMSVGD